VVQEFLGLAGVLAGDAIGGAKNAQGAEGDVLEIADGSGYEVKAGGQGWVVTGGQRFAVGGGHR
jgi:hypothetical protein